MTTQQLMKTALGVAALLIPATGAKADFTYSTYVSVANAPGMPATPPGVVGQSIDIGNGNSLTFTGTSIGVPANASAPGGADINFGSVTFVPSTSDGTSTPFTVNYDFQVSITDLITNTTKVVDFTGSLSGTAAGDGNGASISSTVLSTGVTPTMLDFGMGGIYYLTDKGGVGPGSAGAVLSGGKFQGNVSGGLVPEPPSFALMTLGGLVFGLVARRRMAHKSAA